MEIYLIRHTTPDVVKGVCYGQSEVPLKNTFEEEAEKILQNLPENIEIIYSSPLSRCLRFADFLSSRLSVPVVKDERLKELNFGKWEMKKWDEINPVQLQQWMDDYVSVRCPDGESYRDLAERANTFLSQLRSKNFIRIAVIGHNGLIKAMHSIANGNSLKASMEISCSYGEIIKIIL